MMTYVQLVKYLRTSRGGSEPNGSCAVMVRLADGSLVPAIAVEVMPNPKTGEMSVVLDTREMV